MSSPLEKQMAELTMVNKELVVEIRKLRQQLAIMNFDPNRFEVVSAAESDDDIEVASQMDDLNEDVINWTCGIAVSKPVETLMPQFIPSKLLEQDLSSWTTGHHQQAIAAPPIANYEPKAPVEEWTTGVIHQIHSEATFLPYKFKHDPKRDGDEWLLTKDKSKVAHAEPGMFHYINSSN